MSKHTNYRHRSIPARREAIRLICQRELRMTWPTITQCRDHLRKARRAKREAARLKALTDARELAKRDRHTR